VCVAVCVCVVTRRTHVGGDPAGLQSTRPQGYNLTPNPEPNHNLNHNTNPIT